ncbi:sigma-70 factor domain-containing protein [Cupriavidus pinatubonensis]|uniref:sigma-70 factor domain-containing protein n=1 Tax=Cupriavidus pinatubonensis TaxID=248026 RepID=UPI003CC8DC94
MEEVFGDMGVTAYERAPAAAKRRCACRGIRRLGRRGAEAALSTVDSESGRTTDPVRREMGASELLTRAGENEIAKRIEGGLQDMIKAIAVCPSVVKMLADVDRIVTGELSIDEPVPMVSATT